MRSSESFFDGHSERRLYGRRWTPEAPRRAVLITHGFAEHSGRYEHVAAELLARSCAVFAFDHQGHGRSSGRQGHVDRFDDLLDDLEAAIEWVRRESRLPVTLLGHSMGGLITCRLVTTRTPPIERAVVTAPALRAAATESPVTYAALRILRRLLPRVRMDAGIDPETLSRDPSVGERYIADPLVDTHATLSMAAEMAKAGRDALAHDGAASVPMLLMHGSDDRLCRGEATESFHRTLHQHSGGPYEFVDYPGLRHELLNEPEGPEIVARIVAWIEQCEGNSESAAREGAGS